MKKNSQEKERYLIINPGRPGQKKVKKITRKRKNPGTGFAGSWTFEGEPYIEKELVARVNFVKEKLTYASDNISTRAKKEIAKHLNAINNILTEDMLRSQ